MSCSRIKAKLLHVWRNWIRPMAVVILVLSMVRSAVADWNDVPTGSMKPTILEGDRIFVNKLAYGLKIPFTTFHVARWGKPQRGEIVVLFSPVDGTRLVKRVVGLPGETIEMIDNRLYVDGQEASYQPLPDSVVDELAVAERPGHGFANEKLFGTAHAVMSTPGKSAMRSFGPVAVPAEQYFVMGDNRDNSADSRYFGTVQADQIVGRSSAIALSLDYEHYFLPRWGRFFKPLR
ncbi:MAG: signal peptidase I [Tepidisphaeraceae bacterium]